MRLKFLLIIFIFAVTNNFPQQISSPDSKLTVTIKLSENNELIYNLVRDGKTVIKDSKLGIDLLDQPDLVADLKLMLSLLLIFLRNGHRFWVKLIRL